MTVLAELAAAADPDPDHPFLRWWDWAPGPGGMTTVTYGEQLRTARDLMSRLGALGVRPGTRVAAVLPNGPDLVHLWFATAGLGAVLVPLDPRLTPVELEALLAYARPDVVVAKPGQEGLSAGPARLLAVGGGEPDLATWAAGADGTAVPPAGAESGRPVAVLCTSGSTGRPKGVLISHDSLVIPARHMVDRLGLTADDVLLHVLPLHHMAGLSFLTTAVAARATVALRPRFSGTRFWSDAVTGGATVTRHLGEMLAVLCHQPPGPDERRHRLRLAYGAGASPSVAARFTERFGTPTRQGYGLSETNTVLCGEAGSPPDTLGTPLPHLRVRLVAGNGSPLTGAGIGELQVHRNPALMLGYLGAAELTAAAFDGSWFRTGDLVRRDRAGQLRFVARDREVIRRRGENIDPAEVERAAEATRGVRRAAAIAVSGELDGTEIHVFAEADPAEGVSAEQVSATCAGRLAPFKRPRLVTVVERLPLTSTAKVDKPALRRLAAKDREPGRPAPLDPDLTDRLATLQALGAEIGHRAAELEDRAVRLLPFPRSVIRADIALAARRLAAFDCLAGELSGRWPIGTVALSVAGNAILSNPTAAAGSAYLAGNRILLRFPQRRTPWAAVVAEVVTAALGAAVETSRDTGRRFVERALSDDSVGALVVFGDDAWVAGCEPAVRRTRTKLVFEGPGKDPFLLLEPAPAGVAAQAAADSGLYNAGQACTAPERCYVLGEVAPDFLDALVTAVEAVPAGHPHDEATRVGPLDPAGAVRVLRQLDDAVAAGAKVLTGGTARPLTVNGEELVLVTPAVVAGADQSMALLREETFGPVLPVVPVGSVREAVDLAEDSPYGLSATVYGGPAEVGSRLAATHGAVFLDETWLDRRERAPAAPYGGRRRSGWVWEWRGDQFVRRDGPHLPVLELSKPAAKD